MTKKAEATYADVPAFAAAAPALQAAIATILDGKETVHLYPARAAWVDGWPRIEQDVSVRDAAHLLAHIPPPFYPTAEQARAGGLLTD